MLAMLSAAGQLIVQMKGGSRTPRRELVFLAPTGPRGPMRHGCDVCHNFRPAANQRVRILTRVFFDDSDR